MPTDLDTALLTAIENYFDTITENMTKGIYAKLWTVYEHLCSVGLARSHLAAAYPVRKAYRHVLQTRCQHVSTIQPVHHVNIINHVFENMLENGINGLCGYTFSYRDDFNDTNQEIYFSDLNDQVLFHLWLPAGDEG